MSNKFEWHFIDNPYTDEEGLSDPVLCKLTDEELIVCQYNKFRNEWHETHTNELITNIACWCDIHRVPRTVTPMPSLRI